MTENYKKYLDWVMYQIYPKSFFDSNGDGIGDMGGITQKLEYIRSLGVNAIWICPMYKSPQCDNGYDVSDYRDFQSEYGTMSDFENLVEKAHGLGMKVIMDLVANHTSTEHSWFKEGRSSRENFYHDYYYWAEKPLNDWRSVFGGEAWEYNEQTGEYYLHSFAVEQADVNWTNPKVRKEFCDIVDFWKEKGVDGFRCDVLDFIAKDFEKDKMLAGPCLHEYVRELFGREEINELFTVGECAADEKSICELCGEDRKELKCSFQFDHLEFGQKDKFEPQAFSFADVAKILVKWQEFTQKRGLLYTLLTDNHDRPWLNSRVGNDRELRYESATALAVLVYGMKGIPFVFQGQEIGAANSFYDKICSFDDVETLNYYGEMQGKMTEEKLMKNINYGSRDNSRRPFAWSEGKNFGFTEGEKPWLPFATRSGEINLENDLSSEKSVCRFYRKLFSLREQCEALRYGDFKDVTKGQGYLAYERAYNGKKILVICNFEQKKEITGFQKGKLLLKNFSWKNAENSDMVSPNRIYEPYQAAIFELG